MSTKTTLISTSILILIATLAGVLLWNQFPSMMATHWNGNDQVNGSMPRFWGVFMIPLITAGLLLLFMIIPSIDPLKANIQQFRDDYNTFIVLITAFLFYVYALTLAWNTGYTNFRMGTALLPAMGLLLIFAGRLISKAKRNYFIGIRTPWTLSSDSVWNATHKLGGKLFIAAGLISFLGVFFPDYAIWFILFPLIIASLVSVVYSYVLYRAEQIS